MLKAFERNKEGMLSAWCPFCHEFHHHGKGEGHRVAHCKNNDSPFYQTGYELKLINYPYGLTRKED